MTVSDSLPIQFWTYTSQTHNEKEVCGMTAPKCYCQRFNCDTVIPLQVQDETGLTITAYLVDSDGGYLTEFAFTESSTGVYSVELDTTIASPNLCNTTFQVLLSTGAFEDTPEFKSDCVNISNGECSVDILYSNSNDFDGIVYQLFPVPEFTISIPAIFFQEENPQEREDLELSNGTIVSLRQSIVEKRLLEIGYLPNYMHKKIQKILMHETITIDGDSWIRRDDYETSPVKDYGLKKAQIWLTKIDSIDRNII